MVPGRLPRGQSRARASLARLWLCVLCALLAGAGCASDPVSPFADPGWERQMRAGVDAANAADPATAIASFERAVEAAQREPENPNRLAYASWHLGDLCFKQPDFCEPGKAERSTRQAFDAFASNYGPEHPVVIPVLLRLGDIRAGQGDAEGAEQLREQADRITERWFPESHYIRSRMGAYRPASSLHPQELLRILSELDLLDG